MNQVYSPLLRILLILGISISMAGPAWTQASCAGPGSIDKGTSAFLDANGDGFFTIYNNSGFTLSSNEVLELEQLIGAGGADRDWTALTGTEPNSDISSSGNCGNTDLVTDADGGNDYAYYSVVDPDGIANNGDERLVFVLRVADKVSGAFGYSFMLDSDNNCGTGDSDATCGNPCFEYEVQLATSNSGGSVNLFLINGCAGTPDCDAAAPGGDADVCNGACNTEALQVCAAGSECNTISAGADPVFWVFYLDFSDIQGLNSTDPFSLTPASTTSGNSVIYKGTNVSDYGGIDDVNDAGASSCNCLAQCPQGASCADCLQDCLLACAADNNTVNEPFPVVWLDLYGQGTASGVALQWEVQEFGGVVGYQLERKGSQEGMYTSVDWIPALYGEDGRVQTYSYLDRNLIAGDYQYRIRMVEASGQEELSSLIRVRYEGSLSLVWSEFNREIQIVSPEAVGGDLRLYALNGQELFHQQVPQGESRISISDLEIPAGLVVAKFETDSRRMHSALLNLR